MATPALDQWARQRRDVNDQWGQERATNEYARFISQQRATRSIRGYKREFRRELPSYSASQGARGIAGGGVRSGVARSAMQNYLGDYSRGLGDLRLGREQGNEQYVLQQTRIDQERERALAEIEARRADEIARTAAQLNALLPYMGR